MVHSGFYNSVGNDRLYDAEDMGSLFDGIINDGVYGTIYNQFRVSSTNQANTVTVGTGRAWFKRTWIYNDSVLSINVPSSGYIVIEINRSDRINRIRWISNYNSSYQYPIAKIDRVSNGNVISQSQITNMVGSSACPLVTGPLKVMTIDQITAQWTQEWKEYKIDKDRDWEAFKTKKDEEITEYFKHKITTGIDQKWELWRDARSIEWTQFKAARSNEWYVWLNTNTKIFKDQWDTWFYNNTVGKAEKWEAWYAQFKIDCKDQWDTWFYNTTVGQIEKWWAWWEEYHEVMTSNMIKQWWEWWHPFKDNAEQEYQTWWEEFKDTADENWNLWWQEHPLEWEVIWDEWWNDHPLVYEKNYEEWYEKISDHWAAYKDEAERWFEDFQDEYDSKRAMPIGYELTDENGEAITDENGDPIESRNWFLVK